MELQALDPAHRISYTSDIGDSTAVCVHVREASAQYKYHYVKLGALLDLHA